MRSSAVQDRYEHGVKAQTNLVVRRTMTIASLFLKAEKYKRDFLRNKGVRKEKKIERKANCESKKELSRKSDALLKNGQTFVLANEL